MNVLTIFAYLFATLFLIVLFRALRRVWPIYFEPVGILWKKHVLRYRFFYFNKGRTKILAKDEKQAFDKYKAYKAATRKSTPKFKSIV